MKMLPNPILAAVVVTIVPVGAAEDPTFAEHIAPLVHKKCTGCHRDGQAAPFTLEGETVAVTPSIGVACFPNDGTDADSLLKHADAAMYEAKRGGKNAVRFHNRELTEAAERRYDWVTTH